jgi:membrane fusion protein, multidrug efflux system
LRRASTTISFSFIDGPHVPMGGPLEEPNMTWRGVLGSIVLFAAVGGAGWYLFRHKQAADRAAAAAVLARPEPVEVVAVAQAQTREHQRTTTAIGTIMALRSITVRNQVPGTVVLTNLVPGQIVEQGAVLVKLDVSVEEAELEALEAQSALAEVLLGRMTRARENKAASEMELDRARAEKDVAIANIARTKAIIDRKILLAPFRARIGIADLHVGQYLNAGTELTTLQGVDDTVHVDFSVAQAVAETLRPQDKVDVSTMQGGAPVAATVVAVDARVDAATRNAVVRATMPRTDALVPGASVRVRIPVGPPRTVVTVPVSALRRGPSGDHVFVVLNAKDGRARATMKHVTAGPMLGDDVVILTGLAAGESVAASGSFKLREGVLVAAATPAAPSADSRAQGGG